VAFFDFVGKREHAVVADAATRHTFTDNKTPVRGGIPQAKVADQIVVHVASMSGDGIRYHPTKAAAQARRPRSRDNPGEFNRADYFPFPSRAAAVPLPPCRPPFRSAPCRQVHRATGNTRRRLLDPPDVELSPSQQSRRLTLTSRSGCWNQPSVSARTTLRSACVPGSGSARRRKASARTSSIRRWHPHAHWPAVRARLARQQGERFCLVFLINFRVDLAAVEVGEAVECARFQAVLFGQALPSGEIIHPREAQRVRSFQGVANGNAAVERKGTQTLRL
jgi:hypothetical protein